MCCPVTPLRPYDVLIHLYRGGFLCTLYSWRPFTVSFRGELNEFQHHVGNIALRCGHWQSVTTAMHNENLVFAAYFVSVDYAMMLEIFKLLLQIFRDQNKTRKYIIKGYWCAKCGLTFSLFFFFSFFLVIFICYE